MAAELLITIKDNGEGKIVVYQTGKSDKTSTLETRMLEGIMDIVKKYLHLQGSCDVENMHDKEN